MSETKKRSLEQDEFVAVESKKRKKQKKKLLEQPEFTFNKTAFTSGMQGIVGIKDVRDLCLHLLIDAPAPKWIPIKNKNGIQHVVLLFTPGVTQVALGLEKPTNGVVLPQPVTTPESAAQCQCPIFPKLFTHYCPTKAPGDRYKLHSCAQVMLTTPVPPKDKEIRNQERQRRWKEASNPSHFCLSEDAMLESLYPIPHYANTVPFGATDLPQSTKDFEAWRTKDGWIQTPQSQLSEAIKLFAIDCEMVMTSEGSVLARVSIVNERDELVYDTLVKPSAPVTDYATQWSGMTELRLKDATKTLEDVQRALVEMFDYNTILVGHSLENDLRVLKLAHPWVIDTSILYQHTRGPPFKPSLKWLAEKWLEKKIQVPNEVEVAGQEGVVIGHDSKEDAQTAMELLALKKEKGPAFGEFATDMESVFERLARGKPRPRTSLIVDHGTPDKFHGAKASKAVSCSNDAEVLEGVLQNVTNYDFTYARFLDLSHALGWSQPSSAVDKISPSMGSHVPLDPDAQVDPVQVKAAYKTLDERLTKLSDTLPPRTALIVFTGHDDPREMSRMMTKKVKFDKLWKAKRPSEISAEDTWMEEEDRQLQGITEGVRSGMSFFRVT